MSKCFFMNIANLVLSVNSSLQLSYAVHNLIHRPNHHMSRRYKLIYCTAYLPKQFFSNNSNVFKAEFRKFFVDFLVMY